MLRLLKFLSLLTILVAVLAVLVDTPYHRLSSGTLSGVVVPKPAPKLSFASFWSGRYQDQVEAWLEQELSFKPAMVRTDNTVNLVAFHDISAHTRIPIILGRDNNLIEMNYVNNTNGVSEKKNDPPPRTSYSLEDSVRRLGRAARAFRALNIDLLVVMYPTKGWIWRDRIPARYLLSGGEKVAADGYQTLLTALRAQGLNVIDGVATFNQLNSGSTPFPLYNSGGTHWTDAGACQVAKQITLALAGGTSELHCELGPAAIAHGTDTDLASLINVWDNSRFLDLVPELRPSLTHPLENGPRSTLIIGTSFSEHLVRILTQTGVFRDVTHRQYYRHNQARSVAWNRELAGRQLVIIEQWQWSYLTINVTDYLDDLAARDPRFAAALSATPP
jgi:hypothetical protein